MKTIAQIVILIFIINLNAIAQSVDLQNDLVAYYPFDGNAIDKTGSGNDGIVYGATLTSDRHGKPNAAYRFDGYNDYIKIKSKITFKYIRVFIYHYLLPKKSQ